MLARVKELLLQNRNPKQTVVKNIFWLTVTHGSRVLRTVTIVLAARILGASEYGAFSYLLGLLGLLAFFSDMGVSDILTRDVAQHSERRKKYFAAGFWISMLFLFLTSVSILIIAPSVVTIAEVKPLITFAILLLIFDTVREPILAFLRGTGKMETEALIVVAANFTMAIAGLIILQWQPSMKNLLLVYILSSVVALSISFLVAKNILKGIFQHIHLHVAKEMLVNCWPLAVSGAFGFMYGLDILMLGWWRTPAEIGFYAAGQKLLQILSILPAILALGVFPTLNALISKREQTKTINERSMAVVFLFALPVVIGGLLLSEPIFRMVYGNEYLPGVASFQILLLNFLLIAPGAMVTNLVLAHNQQRRILKYVGMGALLNLALNTLLIPSWGIVGAAVATFLGQTLYVTLAWRMMKSLSHFDTLRHLKKIGLGSLAMGLLCFGLSKAGIPLVLTVAISALGYFSLLFVLKEKTIHDFFTLIKSSPIEGAPETNIRPLEY